MARRRLRVGLNLIPIEEGGGGIARYGVELTSALARRDDVELHLFTGRDLPAAIRSAAWLDAVRVTRFPVRSSGPPVHLAAQFGALPVLAAARRLDVVHSPANAGPVRIPGLSWTITLHDTIWLHAPEQWGTAKAVRTMHRLVVPTVRRADRVITVSRTAASDIRDRLGIAQDRIDAIHHGVRIDPAAPVTPEPALRAELGLGDDPVILCAAQKRPYKNQEALVRALADPRLASARVVLPGAPTAYEEHLRQVASELGVLERVHLPDWLQEADLEGLYRLARCVALPSRLEGFGLPVLEAMARGVPVACSNTTALPEVAGDAALLFHPEDQEAVVAKLTRLIEDNSLHRELASRGRARAAQFTWEAAADATVESYRRALAS
jgi:glycosyltransferase involved in cell wall biosynthesis